MAVTRTGNGRRGVATALLCLLLALPGCGTAEEFPLQVGANNVWVGYGPLFLAQELGYLDAHQVDVNELPASTDVMTAWRNGAIDVAALTLDEALTIAETDDSIRILLVTDISNGADALVARTGIDSVTDLRGATVGVEESAVGAYVLTRALESAGLSARDVTRVVAPIDRHAALFAAGEVDAVVTYEPVRSTLLHQGGTVIFDSVDMPGEIVDVLVVRANVLAGRRDDVDALITAWFRAVDYASANPEPAIALMARRSGVEAAVFGQAMGNLHIPTRDESAGMVAGAAPGLLKPAQELQEVMLNAGLIDRAVEPSALFEGTAVQ